MTKRLIPIVALTLLSFSIGCLKTRDDLNEQEQRQVMQQQVSTLQQRNADSSSKLSEIETAIRDTNGRIDTVDAKVRSRELQIAQEMKVHADSQMELAKKMDLIQEEVVSLQAQVQALQAELKSGKSDSKKAESKKPSSAQKSTFDDANEKFNQKDWKRAILAFQKYREDNPKSAKVPEAVYKIGVCFQELGMSNEAKAFYDEVVVKYPKSADAAKAKSRLRNLK